VIDGRYSKHTTSPKKADILDVVGMLYVGGLPLGYTTKRIGPVSTEPHAHPFPLLCLSTPKAPAPNQEKRFVSSTKTLLG